MFFVVVSPVSFHVGEGERRGRTCCCGEIARQQNNTANYVQRIRSVLSRPLRSPSPAQKCLRIPQRRLPPRESLAAHPNQITAVRISRTPAKRCAQCLLTPLLSSKKKNSDQINGVINNMYIVRQKEFPPGSCFVRDDVDLVNKPLKRVAEKRVYQKCAYFVGKERKNITSDRLRRQVRSPRSCVCAGISYTPCVCNIAFRLLQ